MNLRNDIRREVKKTKSAQKLLEMGRSHFKANKYKWLDLIKLKNKLLTLEK